MNVDLITSFLSIVHNKSISAAAEELYISQSTLSHRLQILENELGTKLFERKRGVQQISLTEDGKKFYSLTTQWQILFDQIQHFGNTHSLGKVTIGSIDSVNQYLLAPLLQSLCINLPELDLEIASYHSREVYNRLNSHLLDIAFAFQPIDANIESVPVFSEPVYMICQPGTVYPPGPVHPNQLSRKDEVMFSLSSNVMAWKKMWWDEHIPPFVRVDSSALCFLFLIKPENWAICPASVVAALKTEGQIEVHEFSVAAPNRVCYMLKPKSYQNHQSAAVSAFCEQFNILLKKHPWRYIE